MVGGWGRSLAVLHGAAAEPWGASDAAAVLAACPTLKARPTALAKRLLPKLQAYRPPPTTAHICDFGVRSPGTLQYCVCISVGCS